MKNTQALFIVLDTHLVCKCFLKMYWQDTNSWSGLGVGCQGDYTYALFYFFKKIADGTKRCQWSILGRGDPDICPANLCFPMISKFPTRTATTAGPQPWKKQPLACWADRHLETSSPAGTDALVSPSSVYTWGKSPQHHHT